MQQINLFQSSLGSSQKHLPVQMAGYLLATFAALITLITGVQWWLLSSKENEKQIIIQTKKDILIEIETITTEIARISDDSELKETLVNKESELKNKKHVLQVLSAQRFGNTKGFVSHLTGLSRQHIDGMWLTNLRIHQGGEKLNLQGSTFSPEHVPKYLQNLSKEPSFEGVEFKTFLMQRNIDTNRIDFDIRSNQKEAG